MLYMIVALVLALAGCYLMGAKGKYPVWAYNYSTRGEAFYSWGKPIQGKYPSTSPALPLSFLLIFTVALLWPLFIIPALGVGVYYWGKELRG